MIELGTMSPWWSWSSSLCLSLSSWWWLSFCLCLVFILPASVNCSSSASDNFGADPGCKDPWSSEWTRDINDCGKVHFCVEGKRFWTIQCNQSRIWSNVGHACVEPMSQWDDCNQAMSTPSINDVRCINPDGINPDPDNCAQFLACTNRSVVATMQCPESTLFSTKNNTCELGFLVANECKERMIPNNVVVSTASPVLDKPCTGTSDGGDVADMNHCGRFYKCNHGRVVARIKCPAGSAFSLKKQRCDWLANVQCGERPMI